MKDNKMLLYSEKHTSLIFVYFNKQDFKHNHSWETHCSLYYFVFISSFSN